MIIDSYLSQLDNLMSLLLIKEDQSTSQSEVMKSLSQSKHWKRNKDY